MGKTPVPSAMTGKIRVHLVEIWKISQWAEIKILIQRSKI